MAINPYKNSFFIKAKYHIEELKQRYLSGEQMKFIYFWGHTAAAGDTIGKFCLSQWYIAPFAINHIVYKTAEHYMMAQKAMLFGDENIFEKILQAEKPGEAKALGREITQFNDAIWNAEKYKIVFTGNYHKFNQHPSLRNYLINTQNRILVEASPVDMIWGIGMDENDKRLSDITTWPGENMLGFALMEVRDVLRNEIS